MDIFNEKNKDQVNSFIPLVQEMGKDIIRLYTKNMNITFDKTSELERQILSVYLFGMSNGLNLEQIKLNPLQIETGMIAVFVSVFQYTIPQAQEFVQGIISDLQSKDENNTIYAIVHRGLDGYYAYKDGKIDSVIEDISKIITYLQSKN